MLGLLVYAQMGAVHFETRVAPDTVYVGQQVNYDAITLVDDVARVRLRANPEFTPAEVQGATVYDFPFDTASIRDTVIDGVRWRRYVYHRALFALTPGAYDVPPATLRYALPDADEPYSATRAETEHSSPARFVVRPLPPNGRPLDFAGPTGEWADSAWISDAHARVGAQLTLTLRVSGVGNVRLLPRPPLAIPWATVAAGPERVSWDSSGTTVRGAKEFDWTVTPTVSGELLVPPVRVDYFDPVTARYLVAATAALPVTVATGGAPPAVSETRDTIGDSPFPVLGRALRSHPIALVLVALVVAVIAFAGAAIARRHAREEDV